MHLVYIRVWDLLALCRWLTVQIGRLRYKVDLEKATDTSDGAGRSQAYNTIAQIYADIRLQSGEAI